MKHINNVDRPSNTDEESPSCYNMLRNGEGFDVSYYLLRLLNHERSQERKRDHPEPSVESDGSSNDGDDDNVDRIDLEEGSLSHDRLNYILETKYLGLMFRHRLAEDTFIRYQFQFHAVAAGWAVIAIAAAAGYWTVARQYIPVPRYTWILMSIGINIACLTCLLAVFLVLVASPFRLRSAQHRCILHEWILGIGALTTVLFTLSHKSIKVECFKTNLARGDHRAYSTCIGHLPIVPAIVMVGVSLLAPRALPNGIPTFLVILASYFIGYTIVPSVNEADRDMRPWSMSTMAYEDIFFVLVVALQGLFVAIREYQRRSLFSATLHLQIQQERLELCVREVNGLLGSMLPDSVLRRLINGQEDVLDEGDASVLVFDLNGFNAWSARENGVTVVRRLNRLFAVFDERAVQLGVDRVKTSGDGYWAVCGLPENPAFGIRHHARRMLDFAIAIHSCMQTFRKEARSQNRKKARNGGLAELQSRMGVHCGSVIGTILDRSTWSYDILGETVLVARQLRIECTSDEALVSERLIEFCGDLPLSFRPGPVVSTRTHLQEPVLTNTFCITDLSFQMLAEDEVMLPVFRVDPLRSVSGLSGELQASYSAGLTNEALERLRNVAFNWNDYAEYEDPQDTLISPCIEYSAYDSSGGQSFGANVQAPTTVEADQVFFAPFTPNSQQPLPNMGSGMTPQFTNFRDLPLITPPERPLQDLISPHGSFSRSIGQQSEATDLRSRKAQTPEASTVVDVTPVDHGPVLTAPEMIGTQEWLPSIAFRAENHAAVICLLVFFVAVAIVIAIELPYHIGLVAVPLAGAITSVICLLMMPADAIGVATVLSGVIFGIGSIICTRLWSDATSSISNDREVLPLLTACIVLSCGGVPPWLHLSSFGAIFVSALLLTLLLDSALRPASTIVIESIIVGFGFYARHRLSKRRLEARHATIVALAASEKEITLLQRVLTLRLPQPILGPLLEHYRSGKGSLSDRKLVTMSIKEAAIACFLFDLKEIPVVTGPKRLHSVSSTAIAPDIANMYRKVFKIFDCRPSQVSGNGTNPLSKNASMASISVSHKSGSSGSLKRALHQLSQASSTLVQRVKIVGDFVCLAGPLTESSETLEAICADLCARADIICRRSWCTPGVSVRGALHIGPITAAVIGARQLEFDIYGAEVSACYQLLQGTANTHSLESPKDNSFFAPRTTSCVTLVGSARIGDIIHQSEPKMRLAVEGQVNVSTNPAVQVAAVVLRPKDI